MRKDMKQEETSFNGPLTWVRSEVLYQSFQVKQEGQGPLRDVTDLLVSAARAPVSRRHREAASSMALLNFAWTPMQHTDGFGL